MTNDVDLYFRVYDHSILFEKAMFENNGRVTIELRKDTLGMGQ